MRVRKVITGIIAILCVSAVCGNWAIAADEEGVGAPVSISFDNAFVSKYVSRGIAWDAQGSYQPSLTISHESGLSFNIWSSHDTTDFNDNRGHFTEIDYTLNREWSLKGMTVNGGWVHYEYPNTGFTKTDEIIGGICLDKPYTPSMTIYYDCNQVKGAYVVFGAGYCCNLPYKELASTMDFGLKLGYGTSNYNKYYFGGVDKSTFTDLLLTASVPLKINKQMTVTPSISYSTVINDNLRDSLSATGIDNDNWIGGLTMSYGF